MTFQLSWLLKEGTLISLLATETKRDVRVKWEWGMGKATDLSHVLISHHPPLSSRRLSRTSHTTLNAPLVPLLPPPPCSHQYTL